MAIQELISRVPIDKLIEKDFVLKRSGNRYLRGTEHDSLVIDLQTNRFYWNSMGISGDVMAWLTKVKGLSHRDALQALQELSGLPFTSILDRIDEPTPIYQELLPLFYELGKEYRFYWYNRGFNSATVDHFKLGYTGKHYVIPIIGDGKLLNFQCRKGFGKNKRVWSWVSGRPPDLFNCDSVGGGFTIITEGAMDAMALHQIGLPSLSSNNINYWNISWNKYITGLNEIYILYDNDRAGITAASRTSRKMMNRGYVVFWPYSFSDKFDIDEGLMKFGEVALLRLLTEVMLPNAVHSADLYERSRRGELHGAANEIGRTLDTILKVKGYEQAYNR